jgi:hypothetical protein
MIDRKPFENGSNPSREREEAVLRGVSGWLEPSEPWLARRNGISSGLQEPAYGKCRNKQGAGASTMDASEAGNNG